MSFLLSPITAGGMNLRNRVSMAALTRNRCVDNSKPGPQMVKHYADRARDGTGLIISEGIFIDWHGCDWPYAPVMITEDHAEAWRKVTDAVHDAGGKMYMQAWHPGRIQHEQMRLMKEANRPVLAPSAIPAKGGKYRNVPGNPGNTENITVIENPVDVVNMYRRSATLARKAGFDGVEILAQGGYLPHQFLSSRANHRTDIYGGTIENRCRFVLEVVDAVAAEFPTGPKCICVKLSPADFYNDSVVSYTEFKETYGYLLKELVSRKVGMVTLSRRGTGNSEMFGWRSRGPAKEDALPTEGYDVVEDLGGIVKSDGSETKLVVNLEYSVDEAERLVRAGIVDMVSFGRAYIYNPDVINRIRNGIPFAKNDRGGHVYYGPFGKIDEGYNDWPGAPDVST